MIGLTPFQRSVLASIDRGNTVSEHVVEDLRARGNRSRSLENNVWRVRELLIDRGIITITLAGRMTYMGEA